VTTPADPIPPLVVEFDVGAGIEHAFDTWVHHAERWWPRNHTMSGAPAAIVFEPRVGGRIFERALDGSEHDWGEVVAWERPRRLRYLWHLFFDRREATMVDLTFTPVTNGTRVRIEQTGWDALGGERGPRRDRTVNGWHATTAPYRELLGAPSS
jgi:Activator of Hsp90 ATPase homolog 1-like protein